MKNYKLKKQIEDSLFINCQTEAEARELLTLFRYFGYTWEYGEGIHPDNLYYEGEETCYATGSDGVFISLRYYQTTKGSNVILFKDFWREYIEGDFEASTEAETPHQITTLYKDLLKGYKKAQEGYELAVERKDRDSILYYNGRIDVYRSVLFTLEFDLGDISIYKNEEK